MPIHSAFGSIPMRYRGFHQAAIAGAWRSMHGNSQRNSNIASIIHRSCSSVSLEGVPMTHQKISARKRFYKSAQVKPVDSDDGSETKFMITLDGRTLRTPARNSLEFDKIGLALAVAAEWDAQTDTKRGIQPPTMPMMSLASTAIDQISLDPSDAISTCMGYLGTDTALFWAPLGERILHKRQRQAFDPMLRWLKKSYNIEIKPVSEGIPSKIRHPKESVEKIEWLLKEMDPYTLACFQCVTIECKSLIMALAVLFRRVSLADIRKYSRLEEEFSIEVWGLVEGGHDMDRINNAVGLSSAMLYLGLHLDPTQLAAMEARWAEKCAQ